MTAVHTQSWTFTQGLHQVADGLYCWLQPDGGFCLSNAGLVTDGDQSLLVDTLIDLPRTRDMLACMAAATPAAKRIGTLVNTHSDPDHTAGNTLMNGARIIMTDGCANTYRHIERMVKGIDKLTGGARQLMTEMGADDFQMDGVTYVPPTETFNRALTVMVGDKRVELVEMGPAHTESDVLVHVPDSGVVFTGDLMFNDCHLVMNHPHIGNWIAVCDQLLAWDAAVYVPGHGGVCGTEEVRRHRDYALFIKDEARRRYDAGMPVEDAALDLFDHLGRFAHLKRADFLAQNVGVLYAEFSGTPVVENFAARMEARWAFRNKIRGRAPGIPHRCAVHGHHH
ncbi:MBL fold metallo-hydrolase [Azospirillum griseum]|uniref:MBL fold metallo-hydrolase n=1 Tax=Azospirillum griseum TaxID=2496639 RepID=A0A431VAS2_9PROT|nr:MBL fold metallo-hydrolase [Azospirillum griseum]RTR14609.1 MBL fold metallo-hydrolase [Azospirillum griseum]